MLYTYDMNANITKEFLTKEQMMPTKVKTPSGGLCQAFENRWEDLCRQYRLHGLINSNLENWRRE